MLHSPLRRSRTALCLIAALSICATAAVTSPVGAATGRDPHVIVRLVAGRFTSPALTITNPVVDGSIVHFTLSGGDHWTGSLEGTTTYSGPGTFDLVAGAVTATVHETFT